MRRKQIELLSGTTDYATSNESVGTGSVRTGSAVVVGPETFSAVAAASGSRAVAPPISGQRQRDGNDAQADDGNNVASSLT
jgi:hypothetical protein